MRGRSVPPTFVQLLARSEPFRAHAIKSMSGAKVGSALDCESLEQFEIAVPPQPVAQRFNSTVWPLINSREYWRTQNRNLRTQRDLLLPKLISGEIDVSAANDLVKEAAE